MIECKIERYRVYFFAAADPQPARILLYDPDGFIRGNIWFRAEGAGLPDPEVTEREVAPGKLIQEITMYFPFCHLRPLIDVLRHEDPILLYFNPEKRKGGVVTGVEPVGEAE